MTSERKLSRTTSPETQFLQNFTKKKFMISSTQYKITKIRTFFFKINKNKAHKEKAFLHDLWMEAKPYNLTWNPISTKLYQEKVYDFIHTEDQRYA